MSTDDRLIDVRNLILTAFANARADGRSEWRTMTAAVLKNRLLQLTARAFDEKAFGHTRFTDLLATLPDLVDIDRTTQPPTVTLIPDIEQPDPRNRRVGSMMRIRDDLWKGCVDYSSGTRWVWDRDAKAVCASADDDSPTLPTITHQEMGALRKRFLAEVPTASDAGSIAVKWAEDGQSTFVLPVSTRQQWNGFLKAEVAGRLKSFFDRIGQPLPEDAFQDARPSAYRSSADDELVRVRRALVTVLNSMTLAELLSLQLPASAVVRSPGGKAGRGTLR